MARTETDWRGLLMDAKARGLSHRELADELGVSRVAVSKQSDKLEIYLLDGRATRERVGPLRR